MRLLLGQLLVLLLLVPNARARGPERLPVLCYHQIATHADSEMVTTPERFRQQLDELKRQGYQTVDLQQAGDFLRGHKLDKLPRRPVLITFDDGYDGVWRYAYPELKKRRMRATVFLVVSQVGSGKRRTTHHLTRGQVVGMDQSGVFEFGSHTYALHVPIPERRAEGSLSAFRLRSDLIHSRSVLQGWLGHPVRAFAWPYGHYDEAALQEARRAGFRLVVTTDYGHNLPGCGAFRVRRIRLSSDYDTVEVLRAKLETGG